MGAPTTTCSLWMSRVHLLPITCLMLLTHTGVAYSPSHGSAVSAPGGQQQLELPGEADPTNEPLLSTLKAFGAEVGVAVRKVAGVGRDTLAPQDIQKGDVLARIPVELTYAVNTSQGLEVAARMLLGDMAREDSPWTPYFRGLPGPSDVSCGLTMPKQYLRILQDSETELGIRLLQTQAEEEWHRHSLEFWQSLGGSGITRSSINYAMSLMWTRKFGFAGQGLLIPLVDLASHHPACKHYITLEPCEATPALRQWLNSMPADDRARLTRVSSQQTGCGCSGMAAAHNSKDSAASTTAPEGSRCVVWRAGAAVQAGQPVCYGYKPVLLQDVAMFQYGFLQDGPLTQELSMLDRPERTPGMKGALFALTFSTTPAGLPAKFTGTPAELQAELKRLTERLQQLRAGDGMVQAIAVNTASDPDGRVLSMLKEWRRQRLGALAAEIQRLQGVLAGGMGQSGKRGGGISTS